MKKLIAILVILIGAGLHQVSFAQNNSIAGVSLDLTAPDFMKQIGAKAVEISSSLKAKKCSVLTICQPPPNPTTRSARCRN